MVVRVGKKLSLDVSKTFVFQIFHHFTILLIICLQHATVQSFPKLRSIFNKLMFDRAESSSARNNSGSPGSSPLSSPTPLHAPTLASPSERYFSLSPSERVAILQFMCDLAVSSKQIHMHLESCEEQLTAFRKEKIDINRQKKQLYVFSSIYHVILLMCNFRSEEMNALLAEHKEDDAEEPQVPNEASDVESEGAAVSEDASESGSTTGRRGNSTQRQLTLRLKAQQGQILAKQREQARQKLAHQKQALAEHRRLDEEINKLERRLEGIERDFRKVQGMVRLKPMGKDRFFNRIWWFDGCGTSSLVGSGGAIQYATGRLFIQGPSEFDQEILDRKEEEEEVTSRRNLEEGKEGTLAPGEWAVYTEIEEVIFLYSVI